MTRVDFRESLHVALDAIRIRKTRSLLTVAGVVIGVTSVIAVSAIIEGLNRTVLARMQRLGAHTMLITRIPAGLPWGQRPEVRQRKHLTAEQARAIRESCPHVAHVSVAAPRDILLGASNEIRYGKEQVTTIFLRGVDQHFINAIRFFNIGQGRFLARSDMEHARAVAVIGLGIAETLFPNSEAIGRVARLNGFPFEIVGVLERDSGMFGMPGGDSVVIIPYTTFEKLYPEIRERFLAVSVRDTADLPAAEDEVVTALRRARRVPPQAANDFELFLPDYFTNIWNQVTGALLLLTGVISGITLLVGGIGVMNIMLISVAERTAEIGLRKAVGARQRDIRAQFLIEAMILTLAGGVLGILGGAGIGYAVSALVPALPAYVSLFWVTAGVTIGAVVGLFFGFYPASRAAGLDPIACLRHE